MALKGEAKRVYQRRYMRKRRAVAKSGVVRPIVRPRLDVDGHPIPDYTT